jgi:acetyl esterase/lipase
MRYLLHGLVWLVSGIAMAQDERPEFEIEPAAAPGRESIPLDASLPDEELWERYWDQTMVRNVTRPAVYPVLPDADKRNGKAVVVVPGGGYQFVSMDSEGFRVADALAEAGYAAFVVKYRVAPTPTAPQQYMAHLAALFGDLGDEELGGHKPAVDDLAAAVRLVHDNAERWHVDQDRIGVIGFSAGGESVARLIERDEEIHRLDHVALIYPPMTAAVAGGPRPPLFFAIAVNDPLFVAGGLAMIESWLGESTDLEFHLYSGGNHGFGMRPMGTTSDHWIDHYRAWLGQR